jgi:nicotinate-nucleotide adenylyltransferase
MRRIGLLGGSFNPAHRAHRRMSLAAMEALGLDEVWWLVSPGNPLKPVKGMAPYAARLASARLKARRSRIRVSDFEARAGTRYTVDTVAAILRRWPRTRFIWLMGEDTVAQFHQWKDWRGLASMVPIAVMSRPGYDDDARAAGAVGGVDGLVATVRPPRGHGKEMDGLECTGDYFPSPAARPNLRHPPARA